MTTSITHEHRRAFEALTSGHYENFAPVSCFCAGKPQRPSPPSHPAGGDKYLITPLFVSVVPGIRLTGHDGREP